jgi:hypothetical protein
MTEPTRPSIWHRSTLARLFCWLFSWRGLRRLLVVLAWTVTAIALVYAEENWRGRHAWNKYRKALETRGEQLDLKAFVPQPVPDDQNFAATPFFKSLFGHKTNSLKWHDNYERFSSKVSSSRKRDNGNRHLTDLVGWEMAFNAARSDKSPSDQKFETDKFDLESRAKAALSVLDGLKTDDGVFDELRAASRRPYSRYLIHYNLEDPWGILLPHLAMVKAACQRLSLKACAELAAGQSEKALEDIELMLHLTDSLRDETFLIAYLVRIACLQISTQPVWEGLADHRWSDAQLQQLQARLLQYDFLTDLKRPLDGERAAGILTAELLFQQKYHLADLLGQPGAAPFDSTLANLASRIAPHGWYHQEQLGYCTLYDNYLAGTFDATKRKVFPGQIEVRDHEFERVVAGGRLGKTFHGVLHHHFLANLLLPALGKIPVKAARGQIAADHAALACALERYRLANGQFPVELEALTRFISQLPHDPITGAPYQYRRSDDGQFVLYSVGWDEKDDGGTPGNVLFDDRQGDWVWQYSQN